MIPRVASKTNSWWPVACLLGASTIVSLLICVAPMASQSPPASLEFVPIPPGEFLMGCMADDITCYSDEKPAHPVKITKQFELGKYEVTQAQWKAINGGQPSSFSGAARPVEMVSWNEIQGFLSKLNQRRDGFRYRLPTEAEWEYAYRAGAVPARESSEATGWYDHNAGGQTHVVGQKQPNAWGLYDMGGNVWEWVEDWYDVYSGYPETNPSGPAKGLRRVLRGGSWVYGAKYTRATVRFFNVPTLQYNDTGFRCARERIQ